MRREGKDESQFLSVRGIPLSLENSPQNGKYLGSFRHYRLTLETMLKNHLEFLRREPSHSSGKYISKGEGEETKGGERRGSRRKSSTIPSVKEKEREGGPPSRK